MSNELNEVAEPFLGQSGASAVNRSAATLETFNALTGLLSINTYIINLRTMSVDFMNKNAEDLFGHTVAEMQAKGPDFLKTMCHPDDTPLLKERFEAVTALGPGEHVNSEFRIRRRDGTYVWQRSTDTVFERDEDGAVLSICGIAFDVSRYKRIEKELKNLKKELESSVRDKDQELDETKAFLEHALNLMPGIIYVYNQKTRSNEFANKSIARLIGYTNKEIRAMGSSVMAQIMHPSDLPRIDKHFTKLSTISDNEIHSIEYRLRHKNGEYLWFLSLDTPFQRDNDGQVIKHIGVATNISEQKKAEQNLLEIKENLEALVKQGSAEVISQNEELDRANRLLEAVIQTASSAILALDHNGRILILNDAARHVLGGLNGPPPLEWPDDIHFLEAANFAPLDASANPINRALAGLRLRNETNVMTRKSGSFNRYVRVSSASIADDDLPVSAVIVLDDISDQEVARQQVERSSRLDALGQLTGGIAHDFNNLLAAIQYSIELAMRELPKNGTQNLLNTALGAVDRGAALSRRLLAFAKRQPGLSESRPMQGVRDEFMQLIEPTIEEAIETTFKLETPNLNIFCDIGQLENSLLNLVLNARDAIVRSGVGDKITITARGQTDVQPDASVVVPIADSARSAEKTGTDAKDSPSDDRQYRYVEIAVSDNGPGMSEEVKRRAIDPFFTTKDTNSGTGLGLSTVYGFVRQSDGELRLYSEPGQGTTVRMILPRGTSDGRRELPVERLPSERGEGEHILVVEDEPTLLDMLTRTIEELGYRVTGVPSGGAALDELSVENDLELMLTDIVMPGGISGFELANKVRGINPDIKIVYMSGYTGYRESEMGEIIAPMLAKPCPERELAHVIRSQLSGG